MYQIYVRDRNLHRVGVLAAYSKLSATLSFNGVGKWMLELNEGTRGAELIKDVRRQRSGLGGILVEREDQLLFSGSIRNVEVISDWLDSGGEVLRVEGIDDNGLLATRLAMPPPYTARAGTGIGYDVFVGKAEAAMIHLVRKNVAEDAATGTYPRQIMSLTTPVDQGRGRTLTVRSRYHSLLTKLQECALPDGLGFQLIQRGPAIHFEVSQPASGQVVTFSRELRNLAGYRYRVDAPQGNFFIGGGTGEDTARNFAYLGDEPSRTLYGTIENFLDQRNVADQNELIALLRNELLEKTETIEVEFQPLDVEPYRFMRDWRLGTMARIELEGEVIQDMIRSVSIEVTDEGGKIIPIIGTTGIGTKFRLFDQVRNLEGRLGKLERR